MRFIQSCGVLISSKTGRIGNLIAKSRDSSSKRQGSAMVRVLPLWPNSLSSNLSFITCQLWRLRLNYVCLGFLIFKVGIKRLLLTLIVDGLKWHFNGSENIWSKESLNEHPVSISQLYLNGWPSKVALYKLCKICKCCKLCISKWHHSFSILFRNACS